MTALLPDHERWATHLYSGGWREASATLQVTEPATGTALARVGAAGAEDVDAA